MSYPVRHFTSAYREHATLRDGSQIVMRLLAASDKHLLKAGFERLSPESRYARFFAPKLTLTDHELRYLCEIDQESHLAIGAIRQQAGTPLGEPAASEGLGVARFIALPGVPATAEAAITVADEAQGRGLGKLLFLRLCAAARERGLERFRCEVLGSNAGMQHLLEHIAPERRIEVGGGVMSIELAIPDVAPTASGTGDAPAVPMYRLLRAAAENTVEWTDAVCKLWGR